MIDYSTITAKIADLKAKVEQSSISPIYLGSILDDFISMMKAIDMTDMSDDIKTAIADSITALSKANEALSKGSSALSAVNSIATTVSTLQDTVKSLASVSSETRSKLSSLEATVGVLENFTETLRSSVDNLSDTADLIDGRLVQLEQLNIVPLVYMSAYTKALSTSADLLNRVKLDRPGLQLVMDLTTARVKNDFLVLVREDGSAVINPLPFAKKAGFGTSDFNTSYYYRYAQLFLTAKESARIRPVFMPASDTEAAIEELSARMDRLEELSGGENSGELEGSILSSITEALTVAKTARSRALEAIDAAGEAQQAVASVSLMAERVAPYLRYHAMPVTAVRPDGCFDSDGPGIYLVPANDKYEWTNFEFGNINDQPGTPWDTWESPEKAQAWEEHWEAVKTALSLPYDLNLMDFGTVSDADDAMDANDGLYFCIEEQRYYRVTANGSILEPMLFPSDLEEFTDEDIEAAAQKALNSVNNK